MAIIINLICNDCNKTFSVKKGKERLFCSNDCKSKNRKEKNQKYYIEKNCDYCNKLFLSKIKENKKFCSYACSGLYKKKESREERNCIECGNLFSERKKHERKFCSETCRKKWQTKPENIKKRINESKKSILKKYNVENTFQIDEIRLKAIENSNKTYELRGKEILKENLSKLNKKREKNLLKRFLEKGYKILEFKNENLLIQHPDGHVFENNRKLLVNRLNHNVELSTIIQPIGSPRTTFERKICKFLDENNIQYITNNRKIINGELDIYIPEHKIAIEINGLYWHSEYYLNNDYHLIKTKNCLQKNIQLLHFFEDELIENYDIVLSIIKSKLNIFNNKINARKCIVKEINSKLSSEFLINNHIEGNINSNIRFGLFNNDELVSVMTFKKIGENKYEILRFCDRLDTLVINSINNLLEYFTKNYNPKSISVSINRRYDNGDLYKNLGFEFVKNTKPNYWYVIGKKRKHRFLFTKNKLINEGYDKNKTEHQIMIERNIPKIYDCGNIKFIDIKKPAN